MIVREDPSLMCVCHITVKSVKRIFTLPHNGNPIHQITPKITFFDPNLTCRFPKSHKNPGVGGWENRFGKGLPKKRFFFTPSLSRIFHREKRFEKLNVWCHRHWHWEVLCQRQLAAHQSTSNLYCHCTLSFLGWYKMFNSFWHNYEFSEEKNPAESKIYWRLKALFLSEVAACSWLPRPTRGELRAHWVSVSQHRWYNDVDNGDVLSIITDCPLDLPQNVLTISILLSKDSPCFDLYTIHLSIILQTLQCSYGCLFSYPEQLNRWPCRSLCHSIYFGTY